MDGKKLDALERLGRLRDAGALSEEEFQAEKQAIMKGPSGGPSVGNSAASSSDEETRAPAELLGPMTERRSGLSSEESRVPVWGRKKRGLSPWGIAGLVALVFLATFGSAMWFLNRADYETYSFMATGPANVRDQPTATAGRVVAQLAEGDFIAGRVQGSGDTQWVKITEGALRGSFVWAGNLVTEGPDETPDIEGHAGAETQTEQTLSVSPELARIMQKNAVRNTPWRAVEEFDARHTGGYGDCRNLGQIYVLVPRASGFIFNGEVVSSRMFTEIYRAGNRYIWSQGGSYYVADFLPNEMIRRDENGNVSAGTERSMKCNMPNRASISAPSSSQTSRQVLFTPQGITNPNNLSGAGCGDVVAARAALNCSAQILGSMPNASYASRVRTAYSVADRQSQGRCRADFSRWGQISEMAAQQALGDVYPAIAETAVHGGDVSEQAISQCIRKVVGRMAGAGLR